MRLGRVLIASDLDGTLIYSRRRINVDGEAMPLRTVETIDAAPSSFMTRAAADQLSRLSSRLTFVPATARTEQQYRRLTLPATARYVVVANGGALLVDGVVDSAWARQVAVNLRHGMDFGDVLAHASRACRSDWTTAIRTVDELFCYASVIPHLMPLGWIEQERAWAATRGWRTSLQGHKFYWVPAALTKSAAVAEVVRRTAADQVLAAGDAMLDVDLLEFATRGVHPGHGELAEIGWSSPTVTRLEAQGVLAGAAIVEWFAAMAARLGAYDDDGVPGPTPAR